MNVEQGAHFRLRAGKWPGPLLLEFLAPVAREIAIQVEPLRLAWRVQPVRIEVDKPSLRNHPVILAAPIGRTASNEKPLVLGMGFPRTIVVFDAHVENLAVAIDVLDDQALEHLLVERVRAGAGTNQARLFCHRPFGAIWVDPRTDVEAPARQAMIDIGVVTDPVDDPFNEVKACRTGA